MNTTSNQGGERRATHRRRPTRKATVALSMLTFVGSLATVAMLAIVVGCVAGASSTQPRGHVVGGPPPAPLNENRPPPPGPQAAWVAGYWHWNGATYTWIPGHWESAPPGMAWYGPTYSSSADGRHFYEPGAFRPAGGPAAAPPPRGAPPANANALR